MANKPYPGLAGGTIEQTPRRTRHRIGSTEYVSRVLGDNQYRPHVPINMMGQPERIAVTVPIGTIATTGATTALMVVPKGGRLVAAYFYGLTALTADDTNYITFSVANRLASGSGTTAMLAATDPNTTKATGGSSLVAKGTFPLTVHGTAANLYVAEGDTVEVLATVTGTLGGTKLGTGMVLIFESIPAPLFPVISRIAGSPSVLVTPSVNGGEIKCLLSATNEAQGAFVTFGDNLCLDGGKRTVLSGRIKIGTISTAERVVFGLGSAYNATLNSVTHNAWFRLQATMDLQIETDDNTTDNALTDTTYNVTADTWYNWAIDMTDKSNVTFWWDGRIVGTMSMAAIAANPLQLFVGVQKDSGTGVPYIHLQGPRFDGDLV